MPYSCLSLCNRVRDCYSQPGLGRASQHSTLKASAALGIEALLGTETVPVQPHSPYILGKLGFSQRTQMFRIFRIEGILLKALKLLRFLLGS